ncbi:hypothetical protein AY600_03175 [Phormidium willei BDU 130791]|nr:hypothetical protein AY600_03175 [Phormidium willei BDU 130791]
MGPEKLRASRDEVAIIADQMGQLEILIDANGQPSFVFRVKSSVFSSISHGVEFHGVESVQSPRF